MKILASKLHHARAVPEHLEAILHGGVTAIR